VTSSSLSSHRRAGVVCLIILLCIAASSWLPARAEDPARSPMAKAPDFSAKDLSGKTIHLADLLKTGPVLVDFWTTWCKPCKNELPELDKLHRAYRDRGFKVVAIAEDDPKTVLGVKQIVTQKKWEMIILTDTKKDVGNSFNVRNYPTSFLIAQDGTIVNFAQGYMPGDEKPLEAKVVGLLGQGAGTTSTSGTTRGSGESK